MASNKTKRKAQPAAAATSQRDAAKAPVKAKSSEKSAPAAKKSNNGAKDGKKGSKPSIFTRVSTYFKNVRTEMKRVVWPSRDELVKYSVAVVAMLVFFGVLIAVVDSLILPALYAFSGLR